MSNNEWTSFHPFLYKKRANDVYTFALFYCFNTNIWIYFLLFCSILKTSLLQVSILHTVHFAGLNEYTPQYQEHCHIHIPMLGAIL